MHPVLDIWEHAAVTDGRELVLPDGCRDLIIVEEPGGVRDAFVSELHAVPHLARIAAGSRLTGFRLRPGSVVDETRLLARLRQRSNDPDRVGDLLEEHAGCAADVGEALTGIESGAATGPQAVATRLGVSLRSLQRLFRDNSLPAPGFWLQLARARRAALVIGREPDVSLADAAAVAGYADQAHMTRAFRRFFGATPARLIRDPARLDLVLQPGLATPATGEQISTR